MDVHFFTTTKGLPLCWKDGYQHVAIVLTRDESKVTCPECKIELEKETHESKSQSR